MVTSTANWRSDVEGRRVNGPAENRGRIPYRAFRCPHCKREYGDPLYHGPVGHAPQEMCFDCWASEWASMDQVISREGNWRQLDAALFLLCQGFTHQEAGDLIGVTRQTVCDWIRRLRQRPDLTPEWLVELARDRGVSA